MLKVLDQTSRYSLLRHKSASGESAQSLASGFRNVQTKETATLKSLPLPESALTIQQICLFQCSNVGEWVIRRMKQHNTNYQKGGGVTIF